MVRGSGSAKEEAADVGGHVTTQTTLTTDEEPGKRRQPFRACFVPRRVLGRSGAAPGAAGAQPLTGKFYSAHEQRELACAAAEHAQSVEQLRADSRTLEPPAQLRLPILESRLCGWLVGQLPPADPLLQAKTSWRCWNDRLG